MVIIYIGNNTIDGSFGKYYRVNMLNFILSTKVCVFNGCRLSYEVIRILLYTA